MTGELSVIIGLYQFALLKQDKFEGSFHYKIRGNFYDEKEAEEGDFKAVVSVPFGAPGQFGKLKSVRLTKEQWSEAIERR